MSGPASAGDSVALLTPELPRTERAVALVTIETLYDAKAHFSR